MQFAGSTQATEWTFSDARLDAIRERVRAETLARLDNLGKLEELGLERLSPEEECGWQILYLSLIKRLCRMPQLNAVLEVPEMSARLFWTAASLFKRFYLLHSFMEENPAVMSSVAIYVAGKVEEIPLNGALRGIRVDRLAKLAKLDESLIIDNEIRFLSGIKFEMIVFHPLECARLNEALLQQAVASGQLAAPEGFVDSLLASASRLLEKTLNTDAALKLKPPVIAYAVLIIALEDAGNENGGQLDVPVESLLSCVVPEVARNKPGLVEGLGAAAATLRADMARAAELAKAVDKANRSESLKKWAAWWNSEFEASRKRKHVGDDTSSPFKGGA